MKKRIKIALAILGFAMAVSCFGQTDKMKLQVDSLKYVKGDVYDCSSLTWKIVEYKKDVIQLLIDKLDDTTATQATYVCKKTNLCVGDLAYLSLGEILALPFFAVTGMQLDVIDTNGCDQGKFEYIEANRKRFKQQIQTYYNTNKTRMKWMDTTIFMMPCQEENKEYGHYYVPE